MAAAMLARALLALTMAGAVGSGGLELYPAALGVLVSSKAYGVVRSAVVPRLLPPAFSLVKANSRVTLAGLLATGAAAPVGAGLHQLGPPWPLYGAFVVFVAGMVLSFSLPRKVDSAKGERRAQLAPGVVSLRKTPRGEEAREAGREKDGPRERRRGLTTVGPSVRSALVANAALRGLSGFLTFFLAFLLRDQPLAGLSGALSLGLVAVAAGGGNALGTVIGAWLKARGPEVIIASVLACALVVTGLASALFGTVTLVAVATTAGIAQALGKLSLDALIQRDVPEAVRTSAFARSETLMQMSWVVGGGLGISLPLIGTLGMCVGAAVVAAGAVLSVRKLLRAARHGTPYPRVA